MSAAVARGEGPCAPGRSAADFVQVPQQLEGRGVSEGHVDHALVHPAGQGVDAGRLLAAARGGRADEQAEVFAVQGSAHPQLAELVDEGLPLGRVGAVAGRDAEEEGVVGLHHVGRDERDRCVLGWGVHLAQNLPGEGFFDSKSSMCG